MPPFIDVCILRKMPFGVLPGFTLFSGDIDLLRVMLPDSEFVKGLEPVMRRQDASIRAITQFKIELENLQEAVLSEEQIPRSPLHSWYGTTSARDLRSQLIQEIDKVFENRMEVVPF